MLCSGSREAPCADPTMAFPFQEILGKHHTTILQRLLGEVTQRLLSHTTVNVSILIESLIKSFSPGMQAGLSREMGRWETLFSTVMVKQTVC
jgi:hypothetical protein